MRKTFVYWWPLIGHILGIAAWNAILLWLYATR